VVPWIPAGLLVRDRFDTAAIATEVRQPVLIVHGTADEVVPVEMGTRLAREFPRARLRLISGAHHNDLLASHAAEVRAAIAAQF
jgi:pimeloyl-ACP methyl ester carboxylesterase